MGTTNFERFKELLDKKNKKQTAGTGYSWFKAEKGKRHSLRFLPLKSENLELPISVYHHHALNFPDGHFESVACPQKYDAGYKCPFCKLASDSYAKFTKTDNIKYKDAFKALVVKTHYLLIGFERPLDYTDLKQEDLKIVRASSKATMDLIESKLAKEQDFVDFISGRDVEIMKSSSNNNITSIVWSFEDPSPAVEGKKGKEIFDTLIEMSPDLTAMLTPLSETLLQNKYNDFISTPEQTDTDDLEEDSAAYAHVEVKRKEAVKESFSKPSSKESKDVSIDLEALRASMEED